MIARNKSPAAACRESVQTRRTKALDSPRRIFPPTASATNFKVRASIQFNVKVVVTTAMMVFSTEVVSFMPSPLVCELFNGVI